MYIRIFAALTIAALGAVAAINVAIDPYGFFGTRLISGFNVLKPEMGLHEKELKVHRITSLRPDGLILGSSASDVGLNPEHPGWSANSRYNFSAGQSSISLIHHFLLHAMAFKQPTEIVLGLELAMFNPALQSVQGINPTAFAVTASGARNREYLTLNYYANAFSLDMFSSARNTFSANRNNPTPVAQFRPQVGKTGMMNPETIAQNQWKTYRQRFQAIVAKSAEYFLAPRDEFKATDFSSDPTFDHFRAIVELACEQQVDLYIVLSPIHAYLSEGLEAAGMTELLERWKKAIVMTASDQAEKPDCKTIPVWDFSGYNQITIEVISASNRKALAPKSYWDTVHYKTKVGDKILDRVFATNDNSSLSGFGVLLTPENIDSHIEQTRLDAIKYRKNHAEEAALIKQTVEAALNSTSE
jgi:hypothetical protein